MQKEPFFKLTQEGRNSLEQISAILCSRSCTKLLSFSPLFPKNDNNLLINADIARSYSHDTKSSAFNCQGFIIRGNLEILRDYYSR